MRQEIKVAAVILTLNEEARIESALKNIRPYVDFILVTDSGSSDNTEKLAKSIADKVIVSRYWKGFATIKNYSRFYIPEECQWILWVDTDERFDRAFLENMKYSIGMGLLEKKPAICWRFPRVNLPSSLNYPDYQVRLFKNSKDIEWRGEVHEVPYYIPDNIPLDRVENFSVVTLDNYPIVHLPRRTDLNRAWW